MVVGHPNRWGASRRCGQRKTLRLVLMDIQMPVMAKSKRPGNPGTRWPWNNVLIVAMTANVLPWQIRSFKQTGIDDHIGKPMKRAYLLKKVTEWLPEGAASEPLQSMRGSHQPWSLDQETLDQIRDLVGRERILDWITRLDEQHQTTFGGTNPESIGREELGRMAHFIVSQA